MDQRKITVTPPSSANWLFFSALTMFGIFSVSSGYSLIGLGQILLAVFALANNPTKLNETIPSKPSMLLLASWASGLVGIIAIVAAAMQQWL